MKNKKVILHIILVIIIMIIAIYLSIQMTIVIMKSRGDQDYQKLGIDIKDYDIEYSTIYVDDFFGRYKIYRIKNYYKDSMENFKEQLENSQLWSRNKFYEYIMERFYDIKEEEKIPIDRENLYYYNRNGIYAIFDLKNAKLYYFKNYPFNHYNDYSKILEIEINNYKYREIYDVRGGPQNDGTDYYVYEFTKEKGKEIEENLSKNQKWCKEKLEDEKLERFKNNEEVFLIENGYYYYGLICRTRDEYKRNHCTKDEATGYEMGIYDTDNNKLYYYWTSY